METLSAQINAYLEMCEFEKNLSPDTLKAYRIDLTQLLAFSEGCEVDLDLLNRYIKHLNQSFAPRTVKRKLASIRAFLQEQALNGTLPENPFEKLHIRIHTPRQLPRVIPDALIEPLLQSVYDAYTPGHREILRDIVVLELLFSTGLRVSELCALTKDTVQLSAGKLRLLIYGKGRKERVVEITTPELLKLMERYIMEYSQAIEATGAILFNRRGSRLSTQSVRRIIKKYTSKLQTACHITPHMFRHPYVKPTTKKYLAAQ